MSILYEQSAVFVRPATGRDRYGNETLSWGELATRVPVARVNFQPSGPSREDTRDKQLTITGWLLTTPPGTDIDLRETDRVEIDGLVLEVDGKVGRWPAPGGGIHHIEAQLKEVA